MAITLGSLIEITNVGRIDNQTVMNVWQYQVDGSAFLVEPVQIAEAWWNHVKTAMRNIPTVLYLQAFTSVRLLELNNPTGDFAEYAVPPGEQAGTRTSLGTAEGQPSFIAPGVRLTVGTRATRPGQKRLYGTVEGDQNGGNWQGFLIDAVNSLMDVMTEPMILGAPAATIVLNPIVTRKDASGAVTAHQPILGYATNPVVTSQVSRKVGRGI